MKRPPQCHGGLFIVDQAAWSRHLVTLQDRPWNGRKQFFALTLACFMLHYVMQFFDAATACLVDGDRIAAVAPTLDLHQALRRFLAILLVLSHVDRLRL
jgi:hypothetical protein